MLSARLEALVSQYKAVSDEPLPYLPPTVTRDDVPRTPPEDRARIMEARAERSELRRLHNNIVFSSWDQKVTLMEPLLELGAGLAQTNRGQSTRIEQLERENKGLREKLAEERRRGLDRSWDEMQLELAVRPPEAEQRPDPVARSEAVPASAQEVDLQAAHQTIREFQWARAHILQFIYSALMFEPGVCTIDVFMAEGKANIVELTAERLMWCKFAQDQINGVHKATLEELETVRARVQRLKEQIATVKTRSEKQGHQISAYFDEVDRRDERITKLEADRQKAVQNVHRVLETLKYVKSNLERVARFGDEGTGDGGAA